MAFLNGERAKTGVTAVQKQASMIIPRFGFMMPNGR
jgi:hypothetical protein